MPVIQYGVLVLGARPAGENAADIAARKGLRVATIEGDLVGGECSIGDACRPRPYSERVFPGLAEIAAWDNREIATAKEPPRRLLVIGGDVIGVEMAQAWKWLGSEEVTVVELSARLLPREEPFAGLELQAAFERMGIVVHASATTERIARPSIRWCPNSAIWRMTCLAGR